MLFLFFQMRLNIKYLISQALVLKPSSLPLNHYAILLKESFNRLWPLGDNRGDNGRTTIDSQETDEKAVSGITT